MSLCARVFVVFVIAPCLFPSVFLPYTLWRVMSAGTSSPGSRCALPRFRPTVAVAPVMPERPLDARDMSSYRPCVARGKRCFGGVGSSGGESSRGAAHDFEYAEARSTTRTQRLQVRPASSLFRSAERLPKLSVCAPLKPPWAQVLSAKAALRSRRLARTSRERHESALYGLHRARIVVGASMQHSFSEGACVTPE